MKQQLLFSIMITLIIIVYLRKKRTDMFEHLIDFSTKLAQDTISSDNGFEDISDMTEELLKAVTSNQDELKRLMNHSEGSTLHDKFISSETLSNVVEQKNNMKLLENDAILKQLESSLTNLNTGNSSMSELIGEYGR
jgi:hypothetical protein